MFWLIRVKEKHLLKILFIFANKNFITMKKIIFLAIALLFVYASKAQNKFQPNLTAGLSTNLINRGSAPDYSVPLLNPRLAVSLSRHIGVGVGSFLSIQNVENFDRQTTHMTGGFVQWTPIIRKWIRTSAELGYYRGNTIRTTNFPTDGPQKESGQWWGNLRLAAEVKIYGPLYLETAFNFLRAEDFDFDNIPTLGLLVRFE